MLCNLDPWYCVPGVTQTPDSGLVYGGQGCLLVVLESSTRRRPHLALTFWDVAGDLICSFFPSRLPNTGVWIVSFCLHWWFDYCCCYYCFKFIYYFMCLWCVWGGAHACLDIYVEVKGSFVESVLFFHLYRGFRDQTQFIRLVCQVPLHNALVSAALMKHSTASLCREKGLTLAHNSRFQPLIIRKFWAEKGWMHMCPLAGLLCSAPFLPSCSFRILWNLKPR